MFVLKDGIMAQLWTFGDVCEIMEPELIQHFITFWVHFICSHLCATLSCNITFKRNLLTEKISANKK